MNHFLLNARFVVLVIVALTCSPAAAFFHLWTFSEFFSSADGDVQFIELHTTGSGEVSSDGATITSMSTGKVYTMHGNLTSPTTNKSLLIATAGFGSLPGGVAPDFLSPLDPLPPDFFNPAGDTITLFKSFTIDSKAFTSVPTDGVMSRNYFPTVGLAINSPMNFAGAMGSVNLSTPSPTGDYNGDHVVNAADYVLWRDTFGQSVTAGQGADGNANSMIDDGDYSFWRTRFGNVVPGTGAVANSMPVPEPGAVVLIGAALCLLGLRRAR